MRPLHELPSDEILDELKNALRAELMEEFRLKPPARELPLPIVTFPMEQLGRAERDVHDVGEIVRLVGQPHDLIRPFRLVVDPDCAKEWELMRAQIGTRPITISSAPIAGIALHPIPPWLLEEPTEPTQFDLAKREFPVANFPPVSVAPGMHIEVEFRRTVRGTSSLRAWFLAHTAPESFYNDAPGMTAIVGAEWPRR